MSVDLKLVNHAIDVCSSATELDATIKVRERLSERANWATQTIVSILAPVLQSARAHARVTDAFLRSDYSAGGNDHMELDAIAAATTAAVAPATDDAQQMAVVGSSMRDLGVAMGPDFSEIASYLIEHGRNLQSNAETLNRMAHAGVPISSDWLRVTHQAAAITRTAVSALMNAAAFASPRVGADASGVT